jgi:UDP-N-acetyl-D-mannosaminuronic acid transferase (WecB/TagA/CpsF family)
MAPPPGVAGPGRCGRGLWNLVCQGAPTRAALLRHLREWDERGRPVTLVGWTLLGLFRSAGSREARALLAEARVRVPMGRGLAWLQRLLGSHGNPDPVHRPLFGWILASGKTLHLLGGQGVPVADLACRLGRRFGHLRLRGAEPVPRPWHEQAYLERLARAQPEVVLAWIRRAEELRILLRVRQLLPAATLVVLEGPLPRPARLQDPGARRADRVRMRRSLAPQPTG